MKTRLALIAAASVLALQSSAAILVDDMSGSLAPYTLSRVNDANGTSHISYTNADGTLRSAYTGTPNAFEQTLFLRDDYSLNVGDTLIVDVSGTGAGYDRDLGIAVSFSETPGSLASGASGDVRNSYVMVAYRSNNQVVSFARNGTTNFTSGQEFAGTNYGGQSFTGYVDQLYIERTTATKFTVGWIDAGVKHALTANNNPLNYDFTTNVPGAAIGFYSDLRAAIGSSPVALDNLSIIPVPEPTSLALAATAAGLLLRRRK